MQPARRLTFRISLEAGKEAVTVRIRAERNWDEANRRFEDSGEDIFDVRRSQMNGCWDDPNRSIRSAIAPKATPLSQGDYGLLKKALSFPSSQRSEAPRGQFGRNVSPV